ncbi:glycosyltransferase family 2 protein [Clostridium perfringens]
MNIRLNSGLVTIVIPIYNVEKYLDRCISSVVNQTYKNLEIILVDDGSQDKCPEMCDLWALKDSRIKVIHKKNAGLGMARNTGIENASGEYICFFDSDDYIELDTIEKVYRLAQKDRAEIICFGSLSVDKNGSIVPHTPNIDRITFYNEEVHEKFLPNLITFNNETGENLNLSMSACMAMFSMKLIIRTNWRFVSEREIISEDVYSLLILYKDVTCVSVLPESLYYYCENSTSLTRTYRKNRYEQIKKFYINCVELKNKIGYSDLILESLKELYLSFTISAMKQIVHSTQKKSEKWKCLYEIINDDFLQNLLKTKNIEYESLPRRILFKCIIKRNIIYCFLLCKIKK